MSNDFKHDDIYAAPLHAVGGFKFDEKVVRVFPDMLSRSIPGYEQIVTMIGLWAQRFAQPNSQLYDLGCSLGAVTFTMRQRVSAENTQIIAIDNSPAMVQRCQEILTMARGRTPVTLKLADLQDVAIENASFVVLNFTLQFIAPDRRNAILQQIYDGLLPGGALVLSEKVVFDGAEQNDRFIDIYHDFKRANGYSELEIAQKRTALENVLIPETIEAHKKRLLGVGFDSAETWFQAFNFMSMVAIKK